MEINIPIDDSFDRSYLDRHSVLNGINFIYLELGEDKKSELLKEFNSFIESGHSANLRKFLFKILNDSNTTIVSEVIKRIDELKQDRLVFQRQTYERTLSKIMDFIHITSGGSYFHYSMTNYIVDGYFFSIASPEVYEAPDIIHDFIRDLVANSRKYSNKGTKVKVEIIENFFSSKLILVVEDQGSGIDPKDLPRVVRVGERGDTEKRTLGAGFGLSKVYYFTKLMNGRMFIESTLGKGTLVKVELPWKKQI